MWTTIIMVVPALQGTARLRTSVNTVSEGTTRKATIAASQLKTKNFASAAAEKIAQNFWKLFPRGSNLSVNAYLVGGIFMVISVMKIT